MSSTSISQEVSLKTCDEPFFSRPHRPCLLSFVFLVLFPSRKRVFEVYNPTRITILPFCRIIIIIISSFCIWRRVLVCWSSWSRRLDYYPTTRLPDILYIPDYPWTPGKLLSTLVYCVHIAYSTYTQYVQNTPTPFNILIYY